MTAGFVVLALLFATARAVIHDGARDAVLALFLVCAVVAVIAARWIEGPVATLIALAVVAICLLTARRTS